MTADGRLLRSDVTTIKRKTLRMLKKPRGWHTFDEIYNKGKRKKKSNIINKGDKWKLKSFLSHSEIFIFSSYFSVGGQQICKTGHVKSTRPP